MYIYTTNKKSKGATNVQYRECVEIDEETVAGFSISKCASQTTNEMEKIRK